MIIKLKTSSLDSLLLSLDDLNGGAASGALLPFFKLKETLQISKKQIIKYKRLRNTVVSKLAYYTMGEKQIILY